MERQAVFDTVVAHARKQAQKAVDLKQGGCAYRTKEGLKCFIGCLIPEDNYESRLEGMSIASPPVAQALSGTFASLKNREDLGFLYRLQKIHDTYKEDSWELCFEDFAKDHQLRFTPQGA